MSISSDSIREIYLSILLLIYVLLIPIGLIIATLISDHDQFALMIKIMLILALLCGIAAYKAFRRKPDHEKH